jgi:hypothetical protein
MLSLSGRLTQFTFIIVIKGMKLAFLCANPNYPLSTGAVCVSAAFYLQLCCLCEFPLEGLKIFPCSNKSHICHAEFFTIDARKEAEKNTFFNRLN